MQTDANQQALRRYRRQFGAAARTNACWEAAYVQTHLLARAIAAGGSAEPAHVARAMAGLSLQAPQGLVRVDGRNHHTHLNARIGRCNASGSFDILAQAPEPMAAAPYVISHVPPDWATVTSPGAGQSDGLLVVGAS